MVSESWCIVQRSALLYTRSRGPPQTARGGQRPKAMCGFRRLNCRPFLRPKRDRLSKQGRLLGMTRLGGWAKALFIQALEDGVDVTDEEAMQRSRLMPRSQCFCQTEGSSRFSRVRWRSVAMPARELRLTGQLSVKSVTALRPSLNHLKVYLKPALMTHVTVCYTMH